MINIGIGPIIQEFLKIRNFNTVDDAYNYYKDKNGQEQERCIGYLVERLFTGYIIQNFNLDEIYQIKSNEYISFKKIK